MHVKGLNQVRRPLTCLYVLFVFVCVCVFMFVCVVVCVVCLVVGGWCLVYICWIAHSIQSNRHPHSEKEIPPVQSRVSQSD